MNLKEELNERKQLFIVAFLLTVAIWLTNDLTPQPKPISFSAAEQPVAETATHDVLPEQTAVSPAVQPTVSPALASQKIPFQNDSLDGEIDIVTGGIAQARLKKYKQTVAPDSEPITLLSDQYFTHTAWVGTQAVVPTPVAAADAVLTPDTPVKAEAQNDSFKMERTISLDNDYMILTTDTLTNLTDHPLEVKFTGSVTRFLPELPAISNVHQGFLAVLKDRLIEEKYTAISEEAFMKPTKGGGWFGITDKYWQTALILDGRENGTIRFEAPQKDVYKASFESDTVTIPAGGTFTRTNKTFAGAKNIDLLTRYEKQYAIPKFDLTIDFGWFYFLTKPFLYILNAIYGLIGNMGIAILLFATVIRLLLLPIATKSFISTAKLRKVQPRIAELRNRFKDDRQRLQIEMMNLYKREKINPAAGCLPMFLQIPVFYALYKVLSVSINMRHAPFYGWINDLSATDPSSVFTLFGLINWPIPAFLDIGILPVIMGITMFIQQKMSPAPADPTQAKIFKWLPVVFTFMMGGFAAGLVLYWAWSNILSILQQKYVMKKAGVK